MKKIGKMYFKVRDRIFERTVHVFINYSDEDLKEFGKPRAWFFDLSYGPRCAYSLQIGKDGKLDEWVIAVKEFDWTISDIGTLVHECHHTIVKIFDQHLVKINVDTQEFSATAEGLLFEDIARKIHFKKR